MKAGTLTGAFFFAHRWHRLAKVKSETKIVLLRAVERSLFTSLFLRGREVAENCRLVRGIEAT